MRAISLSAWCISSIDSARSFLASFGEAPVVQQPEMHPVLVDGAELEEQRLVKPLDDLLFAFHGVLLPYSDPQSSDAVQV